MKRSRPLIVGLTGSIGMGKSEVAKRFAAFGAAVFDADRTVHHLLEPEGEASARVAQAFPQAVRRGRLNRKKLGQIVFFDKTAKHRLEKILHPLVWKERKAFLIKAQQEGYKVALLEIPLLFETGADRMCDLTVCVSATKAQQKERVLRRNGMTEEKLKAILKGQLSNAEKKRKADSVIRTDGSLADMKQRVRALWNEWTKE